MTIFFSIFHLIVITSEYALATDIFYKKRISSKYPLIIGLLIYIFLTIVVPENAFYMGLVRYFIVMVASACCIKDTFGKKVLMMMSVTVIIAALEYLADKNVSYFIDKKNEELISMLAEIIVVMVFSGIFFINKVILIDSKSRYLNMIKKSIVPVALVMALSLSLMVVILDEVDVYIKNKDLRIVSELLENSSILAIAIVIIMAIQIRENHDQIQGLLENEVHINNIKKFYYESLLKKEEETRMYRHDMNNHLVCIDTLLHNRDMCGLNDYLSKLLSGMEEINSITINTGNKIIDAITGFYFGSLPDTIKTKIDGKIVIDIDDMKLCSVYSNLLQNAYEAVIMQDEADDPFINVKVQEGVYFCRIIIENSINGFKGFKSNKKDAKNHGIGLENVKRNIKDLNGTYNCCIEGNKLVSMITF